MHNASLQLAATKCKSLVYESSEASSNEQLLCSRELYTKDLDMVHELKFSWVFNFVPETGPENNEI